MTSVEERAPDWITFMPAEAWGVDWIRPPVKETLNDPETFVHHTAGGRMGTDPVAAMRELERFSHNRGYSTIAYDVVVHRNVRSERITIMGAREGWKSAATLDRNEEGEAICLMGYFHPGHKLSEEPTRRELDGIAWGIAWMIEQGWSAETTKILGHRDNPKHPGATTCPGDLLYKHLPYIRRMVLDIITPTPAPQPPTPPTNPEPGEPEMKRLGYVKHANHPAVYEQYNNGTKIWVPDGETMRVHTFLNGGPVEVKTMPNDAWVKATGAIVGPIPDGVDGWGIPLS